MQEIFFYTIFFISLYFLALIYFRIALNYQIIDKPNDRSSHKRHTIRGGGIIFPISIIFWFILNKFQYPFFVSGMLLIAFISFIDDVKTLPNYIRFFVQFLTASLLLYQIQPGISIYSYLLVITLIVGTLNAWNFMDGINGITGLYSLLTLMTMFFVNHTMVSFTSETMLACVIISLLVFNWFNVRKRARCFAGDVGSISIAFIISMLMIQLIYETGNFLFVGFFLLYGLDTVSTIIFRLYKKENIFKAHRSHFYQFLANDRNWSHLAVSSLYSLVQLAVNIFIIFYYTKLSEDIILIISMVFTSGVFFMFLRLKLEGRERLLKMAVKN